MPVAYPLNLRTIISTSKSRTQPAAFALAQPRRGYGYVEPTGTDTPLFWDVLFRFTRAEAERFRLWFVYGLRRGTLEFSMPLHTEFGLQTYTLQFLPDSLLPLRHNGEVFEYSAQVMARAEVVPSATLSADSGTFSGTIPDQTMYAGQSFTLPLAGYWSGGTGPFTFDRSGGALPAALSLNRSTGLVTGVGITPGVYSDVTFERRGALGVPARSNPVRFTVLALAAAGAGVTRTVTAQLLPGNASSASSAVAAGKTLTPSASLLPGAASGSAGGVLVRGTFDATGSASNRVSNLGSLGGEFELNTHAAVSTEQVLAGAASLRLGNAGQIGTCNYTSFDAAIRALQASSEHEIKFYFKRPPTGFNGAVDVRFTLASRYQYVAWITYANEAAGTFTLSVAAGSVSFWGPSDSDIVITGGFDTTHTLKWTVDAANNVKFFLNGAEQAHHSYSETALPTYSGDPPFTCGFQAYGDSGTTAPKYFIDDVRIASTA